MDLVTITWEIIVVLLLALCNGFLAMSEMALVSSRKAKLQEAAQDKRSGAKLALRLLENPSHFLAAIQIGITLIGVFAGAFGGANLAREISVLFAELPLLAPYAEQISFAIVVLFVTLLSLIFGELIPKQLALGNAEGIAMVVSKPVHLISKMAKPAVQLLTAISRQTLKFFRYQTNVDSSISDDEVRILIEQGAQEGLFEKEEESILKRTLKLSERKVEEFMTNRVRLVCLNLDDPTPINLAKIKSSTHSYFPAYTDNFDRIEGIISLKKIFKSSVDGNITDLKPFVEKALFAPEQVSALNLLAMFKNSGKHFAVVIDEHGGLSGVVSIVDLLESIVGDLPDAGENSSQAAVRRSDGSWLVDGITPLEDLHTLTDLPEAVDFSGDSHTLGGFIMDHLSHIPKESDKINWAGWTFEVVDMDGRRVDKVLIYKKKH